MDFVSKDITRDRSGSREYLPLALLTFICAFYPVLAQTGQSSILGTVKDSLGAYVPGVTIIITGEDTNLSKMTTTNEVGLYEIPFIAAGRYMVRAEVRGFAAVTRKGIEIGIRQAARVDFELTPAPINSQVAVESSPLLLTTDSYQAGDLITRHELAEMPLGARDFAGLQILAPGVQPGSSVGAFAGRELSKGFRVVGGTMYTGSFNVEGEDNNRTYYYGNASSPSLEIIQGIKVLTASASSEYGGGAYHVDVALRGGAGKYHGSVFEYIQHDKLSARNDLSGVDPLPLRRSQFGAAFSGPISKDRLFFFGVYEGIRQREGDSALTQVATSDQRNGIFPLTGANAVTLRDPLTSKPFPGNQIPANRFSPVAKYFLDNVWPLPNSGTQLYEGRNTPLMNSNQVDVKMDYAYDRSNAAYFRMSRQVLVFDGNIDQPLVSPRISHFNYLLGSISYTRTISSSLVNTFLVSGHRDYNAQQSYSDRGEGVQFIDKVGMTLDGPYGIGYPVISISGRGFVGRTGSYNTPNEHSGNVFHYRDILRWMKKRHGISLGVEAKFFQNSELDEGASRGQIDFNGSYSGSGLADFFLGLPYQFAFGPEGGKVYLRNRLWSAFVQDDWKIRDNLTLNLGLRYDYVSWPTELYDRMATSYPHLGMNLIVSSDSAQLKAKIDPLTVASYPAVNIVSSKEVGIPRSLRFPDRNNFGPRVGFAYRFLGDTVLRGGYQIDYVKNSQAVFSERDASFGLPFRINRLITNPNAAAFSILQPFAGLSPKTQKALESARYIDPHFVLAYVQSWSLNIERRVPLSMVLQIGYLGNRMVHGKQMWNWNQSPTWPNRNDRFPGYVSITALTSGGDSRYESLQVQLRKQFGHSLIGQAAYTWSKTLRNLVDEGSAYSIWVHNPAMQWGRSPWDRAHVFTGNFVFELPFGIGKRWWHSMHPLLNTIIGGWQFSGILRIWSGTPLTITSSTARANLSVAGVVPADRLADGRLNPPTRGLWFDISAFATPPYGRPGNAGYGIIDGPGLINEDLGLYKNFRVGETAKMQLRLEAYNAFNHVNLSNPYTDVDNKSYLGKILTCGAALRLQVALRLDF